MDYALLTITIVSLTVATACAAVTWRTLAEQRRRRSARVAALAAAIGGESTAPVVSITAAPPMDGRLVSRAEPAPAATAFDGASIERPLTVAVASMFTTTEGGSVKGRPLIKAAVVGAMAVALIVVVAMASLERPTSAAAPAESAPLELVSMRHTRDGGKLTVAGLVRNPRAGATVTRVTAVVSAFDGNGTLVVSASAPLDFTTLEPGDESPFVVTIPSAPDVARYRVGFRTDDGRLRHLDRRAA